MKTEMMQIQNLLLVFSAAGGMPIIYQLLFASIVQRS